MVNKIIDNVNVPVNHSPPPPRKLTLKSIPCPSSTSACLYFAILPPSDPEGRGGVGSGLLRIIVGDCHETAVLVFLK
jgi:hypothetical protein